jgi:hypothetical protein
MAIPVTENTHLQDMDEYHSLVNHLWGGSSYKPASANWIAQIEVELLTGRTHQIRGQLGQLRCPIVGDLLYGGSKVRTHHRRRRQGKENVRPFNAMALQCCYLQFERPTWLFQCETMNKVKGDYANTQKSFEVHDGSKGGNPPLQEGQWTLVPSQTSAQFSIDTAWWSTSILQYMEALQLHPVPSLLD